MDYNNYPFCFERFQIERERKKLSENQFQLDSIQLQSLFCLFKNAVTSII